MHKMKYNFFYLYLWYSLKHKDNLIIIQRKNIISSIKETKKECKVIQRANQIKGIVNDYTKNKYA